MKALIVGQCSWRENFRINEVAESLRRAGCSVSVLSGAPNYPDGDVFRGRCQRSPKESHSGSPMRSQCGGVTGPSAYWVPPVAGFRLSAARAVVGDLLLGVLGPEARGRDLDGIRAGGQPVERGRGEQRLAEELRPLGAIAVAGEVAPGLRRLVGHVDRRQLPRAKQPHERASVPAIGPDPLTRAARCQGRGDRLTRHLAGRDLAVAVAATLPVQELAIFPATYRRPPWEKSDRHAVTAGHMG